MAQARGLPLLERVSTRKSFIGRGRELAELDAGLTDAFSGRGGLFLLSGEPGIGKTRLADEFSTIAASRGAIAIWGRCWEGAGAPPYWPLIQIVRGLAARPHFARHLEALGTKVWAVASIVPEIRQAIPSTVQEPAPLPLDPDGARFMLFDAVTTLLATLALDQPLLLVIDDLHDADQPSRAMLSFAAQGLKDSKVLVLGTYRDAEVKRSPELGKSIGALGRHGSTLPLGGLSKAEVAELVEAKAGRPPDHSLVERLYQATDGNPLFVDGVVQLMLADGGIDRTRTADQDFKIPDGVRESILQRLAALSEQPKSILALAAVIGNEFELGLLRRVSGEEPQELVGLLKRAVDLGIVSDDPRLGVRYRFSHALIRGAIYEGLAGAERARLHRRIAEAVEELHGADDNAHLDQLAYHFSQALAPETVDKAIDYSIRAGEAACQRYAYDRAGSHFRAALGMMSPSDSNLARRAKVLYELGSEVISSAPEAIAYLEAALPLFESLDKTEDVVDVQVRLGGFRTRPHYGCMDVPRAMAHFDKAQALVTNRAQLTNLYLAKSGGCLQAMETTKGLELARQAMELSEELGHEFWWIHAAMMSSWFLTMLGHFAEANSLEQRAREKTERLEDPWCGSFVAWMGGLNSLVLLDPCAALTKFRTELSRPRTSRSRSQSASLLEWSSIALFMMGENAEYRRVQAQMRGPDISAEIPHGFGDWDFEQSDFLTKIARARGNGHRAAVCYLTRILGQMCRQRGRYVESEPLLRESLEVTCNAPNLPHAIHSGLELCLLYFDMDRRDEAHRSLEHCRRILAVGGDWKGMGAFAARAEAVVAALDRRFDDADVQFEEAVDRFRHYHLVRSEVDTYYDWSRVLASAGDRQRASEKFDAAIAIYRRIGAERQWIDRVEEARARAGLRELSGVPTIPTATSCAFQREGDFWTISYRDHIFRLKDMKGFHYIAHLLAHPGEQFHVHDLVTVVDRAARADETIPQDAELRVANDLGDAGAILDPRAKAEYRSRRAELQSELAEAEQANDGGRAERIREELEILEEQLAAAVGLGGRDRKAADHAERTRGRVGRAIRNSLKSIRDNDPSLGHHLETCIHTGYLCAYYPGPEASLVWRV